MLQLTSRLRLLSCMSLVALWQSVAVAAELPTAVEILRIHRENNEKLSKLHLQMVYHLETTDALSRRAQKEAGEKEKIIAAATQMKAADAFVQFGGKEYKGEEALKLMRWMVSQMRNDLQRLQSESKPFQMSQTFEFFRNGDDYQLRAPASSRMTEKEVLAWKFPEAPLTSDTLQSTYRDMSIYSRSSKTSPAARWWSHSANDHAYVTQKHLGKLWSVWMPPFFDITEHQWGMRNAFDIFFSNPAEKYRVVREETIEGRSLVVVDTIVSLGPQASIALAYRGWLDMKRGAIPIKLHHRQNTATGEAPLNQFDLWQPDETVTTEKVHRLPNGAFYPSKTIHESWHRDPDAPEPTDAEWKEIRSGQQKMALTVQRRQTWDCSVVETRKSFDDEFFIIPFPPGQKLFDHDAGKMVGALETKPRVQIGQQAPPLSIAVWVDGQERKPDDFKGQVLVLDFWGLWCGACRNSVRDLKAIQGKLRGKPVTFISIHNAEKDPQNLAARIREFATKHDWNFIAAIDTGDMLENSVTTTNYGVHSFPDLMIIGADGKVAYVEPDLDGPSCDEKDPEILDAFKKKFDKLMEERFRAVGEKWPLPKGTSDVDQMEAWMRVNNAYTVLQIETACKNAKVAPNAR